MQTVTASYQEYVEPGYPTDTSLLGKSIDYMPEHRTVTTLASLTGHNPTQTFTTEDFGWFVWGKDSDNLYIMPYNGTSTKLTLYGRVGYTNIKEAILNLCQGCYTELQYGGIRTQTISDSHYNQIKTLLAVQSRAYYNNFWLINPTYYLNTITGYGYYRAWYGVATDRFNQLME